MGKDVIIRGETYNGVGKVNLLTANGSANFYDVSGALCTITAEYDEVEEYDEAGLQFIMKNLGCLRA